MNHTQPTPAARREVSGLLVAILVAAVFLVLLLLIPTPADAAPCHKSAKQARKACRFDVKVTREFNLTEPGSTELKYYAPGVGVFLEVAGRDVVRLVECNVDPRCDDL